MTALVPSSDLPPLQRLATLPEGTPKLTLGWEALAFAAKYLVHPNGIRAKQPWKYTNDQARFLLWWYAVDEDGKWLFDHGIRRLSKGSGKSPFAAAMALTELCGPVRLADFDPKLPGGCRGKRVDMPLVQIAAVAESQTENSMRMVRAMAQKGSRIVEDFGLDPGRVQYNVQPEGTLKVLTSSSTAAEGTEATFVIADETEHWLPAKGGNEFHSTLIDNLKKSGSRMVETSNAWKPGIGSVAEQTWNDWVMQEEGRLQGDTKVLYDARMAPPGTDLSDRESLRAGLEYVYADCPWADLDAIMNRIWKPSAKPDDSKRKYLNWPTAPLDAWMEPEVWAKNARPDIEVSDGEPVVLFFDGSKSRDATALVGCRVSDGHIFTLGVWEPDISHDEGAGDVNAIDVEAVDAAVDQAFARFDVAAFFADVKEWESFTKVTWPQRYADQLQVMAVPSGKMVEPIAWDMRSHSREFAMECELVEAEIRDGAFTHDGHNAMARHVANARRRDTQWGATSIKKETPNSRDKIDACVCMIGARMVWRRVAKKEIVKPRSNRAVFI